MVKHEPEPHKLHTMGDGNVCSELPRMIKARFAIHRNGP